MDSPYTSLQSHDAPVRIYLLGRFEVRAGGHVIIDASWHRSKAKALLKLLALQENRSLHREQVLDALWPHLTLGAAVNNLRKNLHYLRTTFAQQGIELPVVSARDEMVVLAPEVWLDIEAFRHQATTARESGSDPELREQALSVYSGDLLPEDLYEDWTRPHREDLRALRDDLLSELAQLHAAAGKVWLAEERLRELLLADPLREEAHRSLMRLYAEAGSREKALRQYERCRKLLEHDLGVKPSEETERLHREILEGRLRGQAPAMPPSNVPAPLTSFVGREREMEELRTGVEDAVSGRGRLILLLGEPGIGKTRTAEELAIYARMRAARVLWGRCHEGEGGPAYWPWVQVIRSYVQDSQPETLVSEMGNGAPYIAQVVPGARDRLPDIRPVPTMDPEQARFRLFDSITTFFKNAGNHQPLVLILDDLHWADRPSLLLLQFLARELTGTQLLVLGTYRHTELTRQHPLSQTLGELPVGPRIELRGLNPQDLGRFVEMTTGISPPESLVEAVHRETGGNPFFVDEVIRLLASDGRLERPEEDTSWSVAIPQGVREVVGRRLDRLSEECNRTLTVASAIGREFRLDVVERVRYLSDARPLERLEEALAARVIAKVPETAGLYTFAHALVRETLYDELGGQRRARLHRQVAEVLEVLYETNPEPHLAELAHHFFQAAHDGGDAQKAIDYASRAGQHALNMLAYEEAVSHYERALQAQKLTAPDQRERCELLLALGDAQWKAGDVPGAKACFLRAADIARKLWAPDLLARIALRYGGMWDEPGTLDETLVDLLEEALRALDSQDSELRALVLARLARAFKWTGSHDEQVLALSEEALGMARRIGDPQALAAVLGARYNALWGPESTEERVAIATEIVSLAEAAGDKERAVQGHIYRFLALLEIGAMPALDEEMEVAIALMEELQQPFYSWNATLWRAMRALMEGRLEEAERLAREALSIGQKTQAEALLLFGSQIGVIAWAQGRLGENLGVARASVEQYPGLPWNRAWLAVTYSEIDREEEAREEFEILAANDFADLPRDGTWLTGIFLSVEVCAFLGDTRRAALLYQMLRPYAGRAVVHGVGAVCFGSASYSLGQLATIMSCWDDAEQHFEDALQMNTRMDAKLFTTPAQVGYANMLLTRGQPGDRHKAQGLLAAALRTCRELGMKGLEDKALAVKARL